MNVDRREVILKTTDEQDRVFSYDSVYDEE